MKEIKEGGEEKNECLEDWGVGRNGLAGSVPISETSRISNSNRCNRKWNTNKTHLCDRRIDHRRLRFSIWKKRKSEKSLQSRKRSLNFGHYSMLKNRRMQMKMKRKRKTLLVDVDDGCRWRRRTKKDKDVDQSFSIESVTKEGKDLRAVMSDGGKHWACDCLLEEGSLVNPDYVNWMMGSNSLPKIRMDGRWGWERRIGRMQRREKSRNTDFDFCNDSPFRAAAAQVLNQPRFLKLRPKWRFRLWMRNTSADLPGSSGSPRFLVWEALVSEGFDH